MAQNLDPHKRALLSCSGNPDYPTATAGDSWVVSTAGRVGGSSGIPVNIGDEITCITDSPGGTEATSGADFVVTGRGANAAVTKTALSTLSAAECTGGRRIFLNNATGFVTTLPEPFAGMDCWVQNKLANTSVDHKLVTSASANIIKGQQNSVAGDAGDTGTADDTISFVANSSVAGDEVHLTSDGTNIFARAFSSLAASITFTQAS